MSLFPPAVRRTMADSAASRERSVSSWPAGVRHQCSDSESIYHGYPYLFLGAYPRLTVSQVEPLARGLGWIFDSVIVADHVMDEETEHITEDVLGVELMQFEGYRLLHGLISDEDRFWRRFRAYLVSYSQSCLLERKFADPVTSWEGLTESVALSIATGKCCLAKISVAGLASLADDDSLSESLNQAVDRYYIARQMLDDLTDWRKDLESGFPSLLLSRVATAAFAGDRERMADERELARREIYYGGHVDYTMNLALRAIEESDRLTANFSDLLWRGQTSSIRDRCAAVLAQIESGHHERKTVNRRFALTLPVPENPWQEVAWDALKRLLIRGDANGESGDTATRVGVSGWGDALPLALIADALCDADSLLDGALQPLIQGQADYLLRRRRPDGGWTYANVSMGLPSDADHFGLVVRTLLRAARRSDLEGQGEASVLGPQAGAAFLEDGSVEIWMGRHGENPDLSVEVPDVAVTAQTIEALALWDTVHFGERIRRGVAWIERCQRVDGSWRSSGYRGAYYATAACVRLLAAIRPESPTLANAASFLIRNRRAEGWGHEGSAVDGMSTALALQSLALLEGIGAGEEGFEGSPRDLSGCLDASAGGELTTAFVLRAAVLWNCRSRGGTERMAAV